jgi:hypothetical protein
MSQRHSSFLVIDYYRLTIPALVAACGGIPHMTYRHRTAGQFVQCSVVENFAHKSCIFVGCYNPIIAHSNAAALLTAVLQSVKTVVHRFCQRLSLVLKYAYDTAFLVDTAHVLTSVTK